MTNRTTTGRAVRWAKGTAVTALSAVVCLWIWTSCRSWAQGVREANEDAFLAGSLESLLAGVAGVLSMPLLLWAGMRLLGERGVHLLLLVGTVGWFLIGGHVVEDAAGGAATAGFLALFAVLGGLAALARPRPS
ncbi:hypothetical protein ACGFS9_22470 [Streptomyces sp. NPDC048566]|uniref:hypothetical protein n=1 Tax=Streptomyces sp. NPDC048566 TaxID=3365569 RepID=UPI003711F03B